MSDILFVTSDFSSDIRKRSIGTLLLATILRKNQMDAKVISISDFGDPDDLVEYLDVAINRVKLDGARIVSFYTRCDTYHIMLKIAEKIKMCLSAYVVFGGPQAEVVAEDTLKAFPFVDYICQGEGENTVVPFFASLLRGTPDHSVDGLVYRSGDGIVQNLKPSYIADLDQLPDPDYSIIATKEQIAKTKSFPIDVGRGCPFGCTYCSTKLFWGRKYRLKSPARICKEIKTLHEQYGVTDFSFKHDMFTLHRGKVIEACELMQSLNFPITWSCSARIDCLDRDLIDCMVDAGLRSIYIGIETGSPRMQKIINKNLVLDSVIDILSYLSGKKVRITTSFIYGFPEENEDDISKTIGLIAKIAKIDGISIQTHLCTFLPGTELFCRYQKELKPADLLSDITGDYGISACMDIISENPNIFPQFFAYQTPLRSYLAYFSVFVRIWCAVEPVYRYISEQYPDEQFARIYRDFVSANKETLQKNKHLPMSEQVRAILEEDRLLELCDMKSFGKVVKECYRMALAPLSADIANGKTLVEIYSISPAQFKQGVSIQDYKPGLYVVTYRPTENGAIETTIRKKQ